MSGLICQHPPALPSGLPAAGFPAPPESYTRTTRQRRWQLRKKGLGLCQWCGAQPRGTRRDGRLYAGCDGCRARHNARRRQPRDFSRGDAETQSQTPTL